MVEETRVPTGKIFTLGKPGDKFSKGRAAPGGIQTKVVIESYEICKLVHHQTIWPPKS